MRKRELITATVLLLLLSGRVHASFLSPELEDKLATFIALFVLFVVPIVLIVLFWMVHILPEKIAHKRHHPQFEAIRTLCLLSLVFGGLLWPVLAGPATPENRPRHRTWRGRSKGCRRGQ